MPLPESGNLSIWDISNQFGGSDPDNLSEYYAGGPYVPSGTEGIYGPIPSSGRIDIRDFYGAPVVVPEPLINFVITCGQGDDETTIFDTVAYALGYSRVWSGSPTIETYGSIYSGSNYSDDGWGIESVTFVSEYLLPPVSNFECGIVINWSNANFLTQRFDFAFGSTFPFDITTRSADSDTWITVDSPGGNKNVRSAFWNFGPQAQAQWPPWDVGERVSVEAQIIGS